MGCKKTLSRIAGLAVVARKYSIWREKLGERLHSVAAGGMITSKMTNLFEPS